MKNQNLWDTQIHYCSLYPFCHWELRKTNSIFIQKSKTFNQNASVQILTRSLTRPITHAFVHSLSVSSPLLCIVNFHTSAHLHIFTCPPRHICSCRLLHISTSPSPLLHWRCVRNVTQHLATILLSHAHSVAIPFRHSFALIQTTFTHRRVHSHIHIDANLNCSTHR